MELLLKRIARRPAYTIGRLYIDGKLFCDTVEDRDRDLNRNGKFDDGEAKVYAETAIPNGRYRVTMKVQSSKFSQKAGYKWWCPDGRYGMLPRLLDVPSFEGILIHAGSTARSSAGCIIVGRNTVVGGVTDSMNTCKKLYPMLWDAEINRKEKIWITVE